MTLDVPGLTVEWERIELLGALLVNARQGEAIGEGARERLALLQEQVSTQRQQAPLAQLIHRCGLDPWDVEILLCALAPDAVPHLGWMFQQLQGGAGSPYPSLALLRDLFFFDPDDTALLLERLQQDAPLFRSGLIESGWTDSYSPIKPTQAARSAVLGWALPNVGDIPGAIPITVAATKQDLILPPASMEALYEFLLWVRFRDKVMGEWKARAVGGPVALFAGPSGTGKTFAAEVVAQELGWPLYRIDLGMVVSKYVGETERNLSAIFNAAQQRQAVLLFDEADSLFGKRGEIKEARDRYANMEVSHLLTRMENHHGPCILTTNLRQNIDSAFARRFQSVIEFPRPNAQARAQLWRRHIPPGAPIDAEVDCDALGQAIELTGGQIRNAILHASFLAAGEAGAISLQRIARGVWLELQKETIDVMPSSLGWLAGHLPKRGEHAVH